MMHAAFEIKKKKKSVNPFPGKAERELKFWKLLSWSFMKEHITLLVKFSLKEATKAQGGSRYTALIFL